MKIVIDIPKIMYGAIKQYGITFLAPDEKKTLRKSIANGTPLPEHHGRLIDEKDLSLMTVHMIDGMFVCDAPTIIEGSENE